MRNFISDRVNSVPPSGIRRFFDIAATMKNVISLGIGEPDFITPKPILAAGIKSLERGETKYTSNSGMLELRQAVNDNLQRLYRVSYDPEKEVLITAGVSEGLYLALTAILNSGDEVIVPEPCYVSYTAEVVFTGGVPIVVPTFVKNDFQVTAEEMERYITPRTKAILIGYPNNPTGAVVSRENLEQIGQLAEKHDLIVISDEIYDRLVYDWQHVCFSSLPRMKERTILLGGWSKDYSMTGWRLGYAAAPAEILAAMRKIHQYTIMSAPTTAQVAGIEAIKSGEPYVKEMVAEYDRRRQLLVSGLNKLGLNCFTPRGAFYAFPSIESTRLTAEDFAEKLLMEEEVAVVPGSAFGAGGKGFVRMAYAAAYDKIEEALVRIERFVRKNH